MPYPVSAVRGHWTAVGWSDVAIPNAAFAWVPFAVQQKGNNFRVDPAFDLQAHAGITVNKTYYVDADTGNDGNTGADWDNALLTITEATDKADVDRIYARGRFIKSAQALTLNRDWELIGVGSCILTADVTAAGVGAWTGVDDYYWADITNYVASVWDESDPDENSPGYGTRLTVKTTIANVNSNPGSYYCDWGNHKLYVRTFDSRAPDADIICYDSVSCAITKNSRTIYLENIEIQGTTVTWKNSSAIGGSKIYAKNVRFWNLTTQGVSELIFQNCSNPCRKSGDIFNHNDLNGVVEKIIEIDCDLVTLSNSGSNQASTTHEEVDIVRIGGYYEGGGSQTIADSGVGSQSWLLDCHLNNWNADYAFYTEDYSWLDHCYLDGGLNEAGAGTIFIRNCTITGSQSGDIQPY